MLSWCKPSAHTKVCNSQALKAGQRLSLTVCSNYWFCFEFQKFAINGKFMAQKQLFKPKK